MIPSWTNISLFSSWTIIGFVSSWTAQTDLICTFWTFFSFHSEFFCIEFALRNILIFGSTDYRRPMEPFFQLACYLHELLKQRNMFGAYLHIFNKLLLSLRNVLHCICKKERFFYDFLKLKFSKKATKIDHRFYIY